ncbi:MAG: hypothetical protein HQL50_00445 [Magnetococcales bacterium]|nr:hypothetical protein [Magnetococcales bacterium]
MHSNNTPMIHNGILLTDGTEVPKGCARHLAEHGVTIHALVVGPDVPMKDATEIASTFQNVPPIVVTKRPDLEPLILDLLQQNKIEMLFSCYYEYRIRQSLIDGATYGGINIHPSVLPYNRGFHSSFWGILDETPLGATLHWLDEQLDTGDIIDQALLTDDGVIPASEVRAWSRNQCVELFGRNLPRVLIGKAPRIKQHGPGSYHFKKDLQPVVHFDASDTISLERLMKLGRATSFQENGVYVVSGERKFKVRILVSEEE